MPNASRGSVASSTRLSRKSISMVTMMPPVSRMGARTPSRCIRPNVWLTL